MTGRRQFRTRDDEVKLSELGFLGFHDCLIRLTELA
jgi:hypothetical protein